MDCISSAPVVAAANLHSIFYHLALPSKSSLATYKSELGQKWSGQQLDDIGHEEELEEDANPSTYGEDGPGDKDQCDGWPHLSFPKALAIPIALQGKGR